MDKETERELGKLRQEIETLRGRFKLMLSRAGGYVSGQVRFAGDLLDKNSCRLHDDWLGMFAKRPLPASKVDFVSFTGDTDTKPAMFTGWTTTPASTVKYGYWGHFGRFRCTGQSGVTCFLYSTTLYDNFIQCVFHPEPNSVEAGLRIDNGSDNTFVEFYLKSGVGTYTSCSVAPFRRYQDGGGGITTTQLGEPGFPTWVSLKITQATSAPATTFYLAAGVPVQYVTTVSFTSFSPTRYGLFIRPQTTADRGALFHSFAGRWR
jgi:hypothetical protein